MDTDGTMHTLAKKAVVMIVVGMFSANTSIYYQFTLMGNDNASTTLWFADYTHRISLVPCEWVGEVWLEEEKQRDFIRGSIQVAAHSVLMLERVSQSGRDVL